MGTKYLVMNPSWEYNDEYMYRDGEGGLPVRIFNSRCDAEQHARELTAESIQNDGMTWEFEDWSQETTFSAEEAGILLKAVIHEGRRLADILRDETLVAARAANRLVPQFEGSRADRMYLPGGGRGSKVTLTREQALDIAEVLSGWALFEVVAVEGDD